MRLMRLLIQRVTKAQVSVTGQVVGRIENGLVVFVGIKQGDTESDVEKLAKKLVHLRIFSDDQGRMNRSLLEVGGELLVVSQFTLYAETKKGNRPSYSSAASPEIARHLYERFLSKCSDFGIKVQSGVFQSHMVVDISNDGPVTIACQSDV